MTHPPSDICPHCGQPLHREAADAIQATAKNRAIDKEEVQEHDHRGVPMPRRSRMGGIITPQ